MPNKLYFYYEPDENHGIMVSAPTYKEAKKIGWRNNDGIVEEYIEARVKLVTAGSIWYLDEPEYGEPTFFVTGTGAVKTELPTGYVEWDDFIAELKKQNRFELEPSDDDSMDNSTPEQDARQHELDFPITPEEEVLHHE